MTAGWIKLHRKVVDSEIYQMPPLYLRVFERLILEANHEDKEIPYKAPGSKVTGKLLVRRGERLTSLRQIAEWVGWYEYGVFKAPHPTTIQRILDWLVSRGMIEIAPASKLKRNGKCVRGETRYRVLNYELYQGYTGDECDSKCDSYETASRQNKNDKNEKKEIHSGTYVPEPSAGAALTPVEEAPNNGQLIAELVALYRQAIPEEKRRKGDYPFVGKLYNDYGYDAVLGAIRDLKYKRDTGFVPDEPLIFLRAILARGAEGKRDRPGRGAKQRGRPSTPEDYSVEAFLRAGLDRGPKPEDYSPESYIRAGLH